jgi:nitrogen fixation/metabolism regulation signal transduction histidine kinase
MSTSAHPAQASTKYKRSFRNYLLDARFQLKWTGYLIGVALVISAILGVSLYQTSTKVTTQSQKVIGTGKELLEESRKNSELVKMSIQNFGGDAVLAESFAEGDRKAEAELKKKYDQLAAQQQETLGQQRTMLQSLVAGLFLLVVLIGLVGIYITHKVVGPIYKMKMLLRQVGEGKLNFQGRLRKGDELQDFFEVFATMVEKLKDRQRREVAELESAMVAARSSGASEDAIAKIELVRDEMRAALEK